MVDHPRGLTFTVGTVVARGVELRLDAFFSAATLRVSEGVRHFWPLEAPDAFADAIRAAIAA